MPDFEWSGREEAEATPLARGRVKGRVHARDPIPTNFLPAEKKMIYPVHLAVQAPHP